jgi:hypothetical protein
MQSGMDTSKPAGKNVGPVPLDAERHRRQTQPPEIFLRKPDRVEASAGRSNSSSQPSRFRRKELAKLDRIAIMGLHTTHELRVLIPRGAALADVKTERILERWAELAFGRIVGPYEREFRLEPDSDSLAFHTHRAGVKR